jgi:hypothetical protein
MPFGRWKGYELQSVPDDYLNWLASLADLRPPLRAAVLAESLLREMRQGAPPPPTPRTPAPEASMVEELIGAGLRALARKHHPDVGGDTAAMQQANMTADWLRAQVRWRR